MIEYVDAIHIYRTPSEFQEGAEERQLAKTQQIEVGVIQDFTLVFEGERCDNKSEDIFAWAPSLREWLTDPDYVFWLGTMGFAIKNCYLKKEDFSCK